MFKRMAIWAKDFEIRKNIVFSISVLMVYAKNGFAFSIATAFACFNHPSRFHGFSYRGEAWKPNLFGRFVVACHGAIFPRNRWRMLECFAAMRTRGFDGSFPGHRFVITFSTAIFCFIASAGYVGKFGSTYLAIARNLHSGSKGKAFSAAINRSVFSIFGHIK